MAGSAQLITLAGLLGTGGELVRIEPDDLLPCPVVHRQQAGLDAADLVDVEHLSLAEYGDRLAKAERLSGVAGLLGRRHLCTLDPDRVGRLRQPLSAALGE